MHKVGVLKFTLGGHSSTHNEITLRDVQLWEQKNNNHESPSEDQNLTEPVHTYKGKFFQYVSLSRLPNWCFPIDNYGNNQDGNQSVTFTTSSTTLAYFKSKLKTFDRGIVVEISVMDDTRLIDHLFIIFYSSNKYNNSKNHNIHWFILDLRKKSQIDSKVLELQKQLNKNRPQLEKRLIEKPLLHHSNTLDLGTLIKRKASNDSLMGNDNNNLLKTKYEDPLLSHGTFSDTQKLIQNNIVKRDRRIQFKETLSKLILSGLRLRGIPNSQPGFQKLFRTTYDSAEFAHRNDLKKLVSNNSSKKTMDEYLSFETLQDTVETLLTLYTRS
ncbi:hypothetical protein TBLA_0A09380 [Henningerozyma blattae CBS 6284]|uniref:Mitochondrial morphogenesis protein SLD7 n=1 Tax=Henningerozyma blattae (strain ATCC 34711 / CBS 6284 / DSM 70876 / NBRC 10599 / NRRL Y-10934 / UCD 77-7) TaxID=1071380 RepID=I2GX71_HENB6|nr:hypothetical protein TBLA_0A09380 [Tetrapisispora blattae CBS 6284]CCH58723.1 hypothetical protein TBLA_0A09380 [Tetrapisispora blattae CBS 6284]